MRTYQRFTHFGIGLAGLFLGLANLVADEKIRHGGGERYARTEAHLGTLVTIIVHAPDRRAAEKAISAGFRRIVELNGLLSDYEIDSEVSKLSRSSPHKSPVQVRSETAHVLRTATDISRRTGGAFDVTLGPLTRLWRRARRRKQMPSNELLTEAQSSVGFSNLVVHEKKPLVRLTKPKMRLDLGGIAKGYIVDQALVAIAREGCRSALVNAGGDIGASAPPPGEKGWRVGVVGLDPKGEPDRIIELANAAIATSGNAFQSVTIEGRNYSHIVDPKTGLGLTIPSSVSVLAKRAELADAWASALSVLGPEEGLRRLAEAGEMEARVVTLGEDGEPKISLTRGFPKSVE